VALAGDFFATSTPISDSRPKTSEEQEKAFMDAYNMLFGTTVPQETVLKVLSAVAQEADEVKLFLLQNPEVKSAHAKFEELVSKNTKTFQSAIPNYLQLAQANMDHFGDDAKFCYEVGHRVAIKTAAEAAKATTYMQKKAILTAAYSIEAFALHFYTDLFASGHMRVPRYFLNPVRRSSLGL